MVYQTSSGGLILWNCGPRIALVGLFWNSIEKRVSLPRAGDDTDVSYP